MHICLVSDEYLTENPLGGIGTYTRQFSKVLGSSGQKVTIITFGRAEKKHSEGNLNVIVIKKRNIPKISFLIDPFLVFLTILTLNKKQKIDVVEAPEWRALGFFNALANQFVGSLPPLVVRLHTSLIIGRFYNGEAMSVTDWMRDWMERFSVKHCNMVTCPSKALAYWASKKWVCGKEIIIVPNFIETFPSNNSYCVGVNSKTILFMGSLTYVKGFDVFLNALPIVLKDLKVKCKIIGRINPASPLKYLLDQVLAEYEDVKYLGFLHGQEKDELLEKTDVVVISSRWDNFPMVCIEAMASSKLVIASKVGGLADIISDGVNGFFVPSGNHIILASKIKEILLLDPLAQERISNMARKTVNEQYSSSVVVKKIIELYNNLAYQKKV